MMLHPARLIRHIAAGDALNRLVSGVIVMAASTAAACAAGDPSTPVQRSQAGLYDVFHVFGLAPAYGFDRPYGALAQPGDGYLYGLTTDLGLPGETYETGGLYRLNDDGRVEVIQSLGPRPSALIATHDGQSLVLTLLRDPYLNDPYGCGEIFRKALTGEVTELVSLRPRFEYSIGCYLSPQLVEDSEGRIYGSTQYESTNDAGSLFRLDPDGSITRLYVFPPKTDYDRPNQNLAMTIAGDGNIYMVGDGGIFRFTPDGVMNKVAIFDAATVGGFPKGGLTVGSDGALYGTTWLLGPYDKGTVFRFDPATGALTVLHVFGSILGEGGNPGNQLLQASDGYLYGMTEYDGRHRLGTIWRMRIDGSAYETLKSFDDYAYTDQNGPPLVEASPGLLVGSVKYYPPLPGGEGNGYLYRLKARHYGDGNRRASR